MERSMPHAAAHSDGAPVPVAQGSWDGGRRLARLSQHRTPLFEHAEALSETGPNVGVFPANDVKNGLYLSVIDVMCSFVDTAFRLGHGRTGLLRDRPVSFGECAWKGGPPGSRMRPVSASEPR
jgi:hypothetical protein